MKKKLLSLSLVAGFLMTIMSGYDGIRGQCR